MARSPGDYSSTGKKPRLWSERGRGFPVPMRGTLCDAASVEMHHTRYVSGILSRRINVNLEKWLMGADGSKVKKIAPLPEGERGGAGLECNAPSSRTIHLRKSVRLDLAE